MTSEILTNNDARSYFDCLEMTLSKNEIIKEKDGELVEAYVEVDGPYFNKREAISFNTDGFIGFAG